jgi:hypothetical protein
LAANMTPLWAAWKAGHMALMTAITATPGTITPVPSWGKKRSHVSSSLQWTLWKHRTTIYFPLMRGHSLQSTKTQNDDVMPRLRHHINQIFEATASYYRECNHFKHIRWTPSTYKLCTNSLMLLNAAKFRKID